MCSLFYAKSIADNRGFCKKQTKDFEAGDLKKLSRTGAPVRLPLGEAVSRRLTDKGNGIDKYSV